MFDSDEQINNFLTLDEEFSNSHIDVDTVFEFDQTNEVEAGISQESKVQMIHPTKKCGTLNK